jgi:hypothetical protein
MAGPLRIEGKFLTASETAKVLGVSRRRTDQVTSMLEDSGSGLTRRTRGSSIKIPSRWIAKKRDTTSTFRSRSKRSKPIIEYAFKKASATKGASKKASPAKGASKRASAKRYASNKAVGKKN